jgi:hypothetical protein
MIPDSTLPSDEALIEAISRSFTIKGTFQHLPGGENRSYRAGEIVYRYESRISEATFIAGLYASLPMRGFRLPQPIRSFQGSWVSPQGWSAWSFIEGRPAMLGDIPIVIEACEAFHQALAGLSHWHSWISLPIGIHLPMPLPYSHIGSVLCAGILLL